MKLLIESALVFFGTLMAAALVALAAPASVELVRLPEAARPWNAAVQRLASTSPRAMQVASAQQPPR